MSAKTDEVDMSIAKCRSLASIALSRIDVETRSSISYSAAMRFHVSTAIGAFDFARS